MPVVNPKLPLNQQGCQNSLNIISSLATDSLFHTSNTWSVTGLRQTTIQHDPNLPSSHKIRHLLPEIHEFDFNVPYNPRATWAFRDS